VNILETYNNEIYDKIFVTHWGRSNLRIEAKEIYFSDQPNYFLTHEIDQNMQLIRKQGYESETPKQYVNQNKISAKVIESKSIGIHSGCFSGIWKKKRWNKFAELIEELMSLGFIVFNFGTEKEKINIEDEKLIDYAGSLGLQDTINLMEVCDYFIANDSGLMHIVDALEIPLIALFGPTLITKNRPVNKDSYVLVSENGTYGKCSPCQYTDMFSQCSNNQCMKNISVDNILELMSELGWLN